MDMNPTESTEHCEGGHNISDRDILVSYFAPSGMMQLQLNEEYFPCATYKDIKISTGKILGIEEESCRALFGIYRMHNFQFECYPPSELCDENEDLPTESLNLGFFRLSFDPEIESTLLAKDNMALLFIYWEIKYLHRYGSYITDPEEANETLSTALDHLNSLNSEDVERQIFFEEILTRKLSMRRLKVFPTSQEGTLRDLYSEEMETCLQDLSATSGVNVLPFLKGVMSYVKKLQAQKLYYWSFYYKVEGVLCGDNAPLLSSCLNLNTQFAIVVTVSKTCLSILGEDLSGSVSHLLDFPWYTILNISKGGNIFSFQVLTKGFGEGPNLMIFNIFCSLCDYLYSISAHILKTQAEQFEINSLRPDENTSTAMSAKSNEIKCRGLHYLLPSPTTTQSPQVTKCRLFTNGGFLKNPFYIPYIYDVVKIYVRNVKSIPAGPGIYFDGKTTSISCFSHEEEILNDFSLETKFFTTLKTIERIQHHLKPKEILQTRLGSIQTMFRLSDPLFRIVIVHTFWKGPVKAGMAKYSTIEDLKLCIVQSLGLKKFSLQVFGVFACSEDNPLDQCYNICFDSSLLPKSSHYCFRRLSFDKKIEDKVCERDNQAAKLLLSEAKYMYEKDRVFPAIPDGSKKDLNTILQGSVKHNFAELVSQMSDFWWDYYYRVDSCLIPAENCPSHIAVTINHLLLMDKTGLHYKRISLDGVVSIQFSLTKEPTKLLLIEVLQNKKFKNEDLSENFFEGITITTDNYHFFVSVVSYYFSLRKKEQDAKEEYISEKFNNNLFQGPSYSHLQPEHLVRIVNQSFTGLSRRPKQKSQKSHRKK